MGSKVTKTGVFLANKAFFKWNSSAVPLEKTRLEGKTAFLRHFRLPVATSLMHGLGKAISVERTANRER